MQSFNSSKLNYSRAAFTLVELIVTLGIAMIVIGLALTAMTYGISGYREITENNHRDAELMQQYPQMRRQLLTAISYDRYTTNMIGTKGEFPKEDSIRFFTTTSREGRQSYVEAYYSIESDKDGKPHLAYHEYPFSRDLEKCDNDGTFHEEESIQLSDMITGMSIKYESGGNLVDSWRKKELPQKVMVTFYYEFDHHEETFTFSVTPAIQLH